jgi:hypothetical protein
MNDPYEEEDHRRFRDICHGRAKPYQEPYARGYSDCAAGKGFHEGPQPFHSVEALSWRIGWNDCAMSKEKNDG